MKLYFSRGACSFAVRILINELNINAQYISVDLSTKKTETGEDFLKINSKGAVPTIETDDREVLTENAVILQYLAEKNNNTQLLPPKSEFKHYRVLEWVNYVATELHKGFGPLFNSAIPQELKDTIFIGNIKNKFAFIDKQLGNTKYLSGNEFTLPDCYLFIILLWSRKFKIDLNSYPNLAKYFEELNARPSIQKSLHEEGLVLQPSH